MVNFQQQNNDFRVFVYVKSPCLEPVLTSVDNLLLLIENIKGWERKYIRTHTYGDS